MIKFGSIHELKNTLKYIFSKAVTPNTARKVSRTFRLSQKTDLLIWGICHTTVTGTLRMFDEKEIGHG